MACLPRLRGVVRPGLGEDILGSPGIVPSVRDALEVEVDGARGWDSPEGEAARGARPRGEGRRAGVRPAIGRGGSAGCGTKVSGVLQYRKRDAIDIRIIRKPRNGVGVVHVNVRGVLLGYGDGRAKQEKSHRSYRLHRSLTSE